MKILFDTNIFVHREDDKVVPRLLRRLEKSLKERGHEILIHPLSEQEIRNDSNEDRRERNVSRVETYATLGYPAYPGGSDKEFRRHVPEADSTNDAVDNALLYAVHKDLVDFLITQDNGIHRKALKLGLEERVFTIEEGWDYFKPDEKLIRGPHSIERTTVGQLDVDDPIFGSLKDDYEDFEQWAKSKQNRTAWVTYNGDGTLGAVLILKPNEVEEIGSHPKLRRKRRMKISTLKVSEERWGSKIGKLLISISIREALNHELDEIYLTYYGDGEDYFTNLVSSYGFNHIADTEDDEGVYLKRLTPGLEDDPTPLEVSKRFYPSFYDGEEVDKFLIPIQPRWHNRLFTSYSRRQPGIHEFVGEFTSEGNAIKKAYLTGAKNYQVEPGDILLFYRTRDHKQVTSLGICESAEYKLTDPAEIRTAVGKRTVYTDSEIEQMTESGANILLFRWHFDLGEFVSYDKLLENEVLTSPLQVMRRISEEDYKFIKREGDLDERFTIN